MKQEQQQESIKNDLISQVNSQPLVNNEIADYAQQTLLDVNSQPIIHNLMHSHPPHILRPHTPSEELLHAAAAVVANSSSHSLLNLNSEAPTQSSESPTTAAAAAPAPSVIPMDPSNPILTEFYERFTVGRMFDTLEDLRNEAYEYGRKHNVALTTSKSDKTKIYLICKHGGQYRRNNKRPPPGTVKPRIRRSQKTGCACMIYARYCRGSFWVIRKSVGEHNHPIADDPSAYAMYRSLTPEQLLMVHRLLREHVGVSFIVKSLRSNGVTNILAKDIENIQQDLKRRDVLDLPKNE
ncbi:uncharacterized protein B0P05DRAFT_536980 [Gilbertella persicaria]|uniref:uncharacterized protein n=1 Tax=Gilbertella persicaria TaxID=101096 RepID=UPI00221E92C1|nr:uncharacterized protein B0P05DRAFT_536980 [Gilbertella persicaria]KAI8083347.1 hypothetical protein B0P05DRAFT_536980 [Gilbertella persicaria]